MRTKIGVALAFALVLVLPLVVRTLAGGPDRAASTRRGDGSVRTLVIVTPHVEQIRLEFEEAFDRWHREKFDTGVRIDWRVPGGTSEIVKQLEAQAVAAARQGGLDDNGLFAPGMSGADVFFGGGSFEHGKVATERRIAVVRDGQAREVAYRLARPANFSPAQLGEWFGENRIGVQLLYEPGQHWLGTALSGFGIVYNRDTLRQLGLPEPRGFRDLCDPRYVNMLALADGRLSGSVTTTYESILNKEAWDGWRTLRELCGNARYFASASTRPPVDVSQGEAAAGLAIDFYGRGQSQFVLRPGQSADDSRVGYVDPEGAVYIDADPVTILNGCNDFELARLFVEFCLTIEAQALWQFRSHQSLGGAPADGLGPRVYELRRMPVRRVMYENYLDRMVDKSNPFEAASDVPARGWRDAIAPMMAAFGIDTAHDCRAAWRALNQARAAAAAGRVSAGVLAEMEAAFYAMPAHRMKDGSTLEFNEANYKAISADVARWRDPERSRRAQIEYTTFFRARYREVLRSWAAAEK
ncbi:MAG: ABC transporter substrate-binding protein [Phycisphaeraceae bacterium]|nr:ABC transporter substrate-binding protein [Phycisphaeraceae bacterium]MBX3406311.1 ABC transporter substrate-binding protein [Phycisphaeraceae bacterium]